MAINMNTVQLLLLVLLHTAFAFYAGDDDGLDVHIPLHTNFSAYNMNGKYKYVGCYDRGPFFNVLPHILNYAKMSSARCYMYCMDSGYLFFGTSGRSCSCGNDYGTTDPVPESSCNKPCELNPSEKCGGEHVMSVYAVIERYKLIGCFEVGFYGDMNWNDLRYHSTKMECFMECQTVFTAYFAMQVGHVCYCGSKIDYFVKKPDILCLGSCTEADITRCGKHGNMTSVYSIEYASGTVDAIGSPITFLGGNRRVMLTVKSASLFGLVIGTNSTLYFRVHAENSPNSETYTKWIGDTPHATATPCPAGWLAYFLHSNSTTGERPILQGYRCYLPVTEGKTWTGALRHCWEHHSDLFYLEDQSEYKFLATSNLGNSKYWIGMYLNSTLNTFQWIEDTTESDSTKKNKTVIMTTDDNGCIYLMPRSKIWMAGRCENMNGFICKRYSSLFSEWNFQLPNSIRYGRKVSLTLYETATNASLLQMNLSLAYGSHTARIASHPGSRLHYSVTERVPLKMCHEKPPNRPTYFECSELGSVLPKYQFGEYTCANENRVRHGGAWVESLTNWELDVGYYIAEVHVFNKRNVSIEVSSDSGVPCNKVSSKNPAWVIYACNRSLKGLSISTPGSHYRYLYMCDVLVFGYQTWDNSVAKLTDKYKPSDRILDIKVLGIYRKGSTVPAGQTQPATGISDDMYVQIYYESTLLDVSHHMFSDYFSVAVKKEQTADKWLMFNTVRDHRNDIINPSMTCSMEIAIGNYTCDFSNNRALYFNVRERANLRDCSQSSRLFPVYYCENAFNLIHVKSHKFGKCAETVVSNQPWWKAKVHSSFLFEEIILHTHPDKTEWMKNFNVSVEDSVCIAVSNGATFLKKSFQCNLMGTQIMVRALADNVILSICELIAYGRPGGCGTYKKVPGDPDCKGRLNSHMNFGSIPYEKGMRCLWVIDGTYSYTPILTFPRFRTYGPNDYVLVYEGQGTRGKLLARYFGHGENRPKYPWNSAHGVTNFIRGRKAQLTLVFITEKNPPAEVNRTVQTHLGFTAEVLLTINELLRLREATPHPVCVIADFMDLLRHTCSSRGGISPIFMHGLEMGSSMIKNMNNSLIREQERELASDPLHQAAIVRHKRQGIPPRVLKTFHCTSERQRNRLPFYMQICCCKTCWLPFIKSLCLRPYSALGANYCFTVVKRHFMVVNSD